MSSKSKISVKVIGALLILGILVGLGGIAASDDRPPIGDAPQINETPSESTTQSEEPRTYAVTARSEDAINTTQLAQYGEVGTQAGTRIELTMTPTAAATVGNISWVTNVRAVVRPQSITVPGASNGSSLGVEPIHKNGTTGQGVKVGIIDSGFETSNPAIASNVAQTKSFRQTQGALDHGTSVAETVVRTAPGSQLYLASIATGTDDEAAIDYLSNQGVDIIVHSLGFPNVEDDGTNFLTDNINNANQNGTLFVTSAGNDAQKHWEGEFRDTDADGIHEWESNGDELNCLRNCTYEYSGEVKVFVRWNDQQTQSQYRPALYNPVKNKYIKLGRDRVYTTPTGTQYAVLDTTVSSQAVDLVVANTAGPADDKIEVVVYGPAQIERTVQNSSIGAPGDVPQAFTTAAFKRGIDGRSTQLAAYSSRGPTDDGRVGIDATGYTNIRLTNGFYQRPFAGTSAAAPYIGGVAALIEQNQPGDPAPNEVSTILKSSSDDILISGDDIASGSGVVNAADAMRRKSSNQVVTLRPIQQTVTSGATVTYDVVLTNAPDGIDSYSFTATSNDTATARYTDFSFGGNPTSNTRSVNYGPNYGKVEVTADRAGIPAGSNVTLGALSVEGYTSGSATLGLNVHTLRDGNNNQITLGGVTNGSVTVPTTGGGSGGSTPPQTVALSPSTQSVSIGGTTTYDIIVQNVTNGVGVYELNLSIADTSTATVTDASIPTGIQTSTSTAQASVSQSNDKATLGPNFGLDTADTGNVTIGTIEITGQTSGQSTTVDFSNIHTLGDEAGSAYNYASSGAAVKVTAGPGDVTGNGQAAQDLNGDGSYEDINGNGQVDLLDVQVLFANLNQFSNNQAFDFNGDGSVNLLDVQSLFTQA